MATLSSLLIQRGVATMRGVEDAIARQVLQGGDLATNVLEVGAAREDDVTHLAAESAGLVAHGVGRIVPGDPAVLRLLPGDVAHRYGIFPIEKRGADLVVATSEPLSQRVEEDLGFLLNLELRPVYALRVRILQALGEHYALSMERRYARLLAKLEGRKFAPETEPPGALGGVGRAPSVPPPRAASEPPRAMGARAASEPPPGASASPGAGAPAGVGASPKAASEPPPAAGMMPPPRPTLRGLPKVVDDDWGAPEPGAGAQAGGGGAAEKSAASSAAAALPETIELSPRPPAAAGGNATGLQEGGAGRLAGGGDVIATGLQQAAAGLAETAPPVGAPGAIGAQGPAATPAPFGGSDGPVPRALAAWAKPSAGDARTPRPGRARRKGPFPAGLAEEEMQSAVTTEGVLEVFFDFAQQFFEYCALFVVHGDIAEGRDSAGRGADRERVAAIGLPLDLPSTLAAARDRRVPVLGELATEGLDAELLRDLGRAPASEGFAASPTAPSKRAAAVVIPIVVRGRAVALLFGDDAPHAVELQAIGEVIAFAALAGASIERIILRRKMGRAGAPASARLSPGALVGASKAAGAGAVNEAAAAVGAGAAATAAVASAVGAGPAGAPAASGAVAPDLVAALDAAAAAAAAPPAAAAPAVASRGAGTTTLTSAQRASARAGVAALARMFASPAAAPSPAGGAAPSGAPGAAAAAAPAAPAASAATSKKPSRDVWDASPGEARPTAPEIGARDRGSLGTLAAAVAESLVASSRAMPPSSEAASPDAGQVSEAALGGMDAVAEVAPVAADDTGSGDESIAVALQTPSFSEEPAVVDQESSGDALTVALLLPGETPPPLGVTGGAAAGALARDTGSSAARIDDDEMVSIDEVDDLPEPSIETVEPDEVELSPSGGGFVEAPSDAETAARPVEPLPSEEPVSSEEGRTSPVVVEMFADSTDGLESAIARAAEVMGGHDVRPHSLPHDGGGAPPAAPAPPEETLTEGFPAAAPSPAHLSPDVSAAAATFATPSPPDPGAVKLSSLGLEPLLARAARGPDAAEARAELKRRAERNLAPLLALFPGPLDQDRHRSAERLPPASQCGPLLEAIAHTGARGAATVAVLARHDDVDVRFWAAHLLGELPSAEAADGLLAFVVDGDVSVRRIALRSAGSILAASLAGRPLESALGFLARNAHSPLRERIAAIEAMGQLRGSFFVPILVGLLGGAPDEVPEAARRALLVVTRQDFGRDAARWSEWWSKNEPRHRIEWLIDALMHDTQSIRRAAGDELKQLTKEYFGYYDDLPKRERERAQERYREWWEREGRGRFR